MKNNVERRTYNVERGAHSRPRLSQVLPNVSAAFVKRGGLSLLLISYFLFPAAANAAGASSDMLELMKLAKFAKQAESYADLRLWYLKQTQPKIFVEIETASNATDMGYFRLDFNDAGKLGKLRMLREEFNVK